VVVEHRQVVRLFQATAREFAFGPSDVWTLFHSFGFDFSVWELWGALLHGGRVVIVPSATARAPGALLTLMARERVTVLNQTPSAFQQLARSEALVNPAPKLALRYVIFGGEALDPQTLRGWMDRRGDSSPALINMYGITETTVHVTYRRITRDDAALAGVSPIGRPLRDLFVRLLDPSGKPVSKGQTGEIYVGGAGVARGYLHRPELTSERFVLDPQEPGTRLYRSGDLATELPDGQLAYVGRADSQLKIRGYRVEPGEIESCLRQHAALSSVVVAARDLGEGDMDLVAYVVPMRARPSGLIDELRSLAARHLPEHMRPSAYALLDEIPLTANGKVERMLLPAPERAAFVSAPAKRMPTSPIERTLAEIWRSVLGVPEVGLDDDFFELGGTSLGAVKVLLSVKERLGVSLDMSLWADVSTVAGFAGACAVLRNARPASLEATA
jgi:acyl-coenzyme A synthetase/AMP-(fatty) acid ligase/acyl carrier protein